MLCGPSQNHHAPDRAFPLIEERDGGRQLTMGLAVLLQRITFATTAFSQRRSGSRPHIRQATQKPINMHVRSIQPKPVESFPGPLTVVMGLATVRASKPSGIDWRDKARCNARP